jgi:hypothetical protein
MELSKPISHASINRADALPLSQDYQALLEKGYELIAQYSGALWTNYNDSDPGITILQNLCYALTELGYKANLPIEDLLTDALGNIKTHHQFHLPEEILPVNPVTTTDFSKLLLNEVPELKQVYFTRYHQTSFLLSIQPWLELKPEYVPRLSEDMLFATGIIGRVRQALTRHGNMAQLFTTPRILTPVLISLSGTITISKNAPVEKVIAGILYACNQYVSPYPMYQSYSLMQHDEADGLSVMDGPYLSNGYLADACIASKRDRLTAHDLSAACLAVEGVDDVSIAELTVTLLNVDEAPYLSPQSLRGVTCYQNGNPVDGYDAEKIQYYLNKLIPVQVPAESPASLRGTHFKVEDYYSIQHSFPAVYQLTGKGPTDPLHGAQVNQLKAYLVLFEQLLGDYLAQLRNVDKLFSFDSGRTDRTLSSPTYFSQPLYSIPGVERVLVGVKNHGYFKQSSSPNDWHSYRQDTHNPYALLLTSDHDGDTDNLSRRKRALEHLLARYGKAYDHQPWHVANPGYGEDTLAEIEYLTHTLKTFPLLSANRARTFFQVPGYASLVSGLELNLENELGLIPFLKGTRDALRSGLSAGVGLEVIYYDGAGKANRVFPSPYRNEATAGAKNITEVIWNGEVILSLTTPEPVQAMSLTAVSDWLTPWLTPIEILIENQTGLVMLDVARLADFLSFRWILKAVDGSVLFTSGALSVDRLEQRALVLSNEFSLEIKEVRKEAEYEIGARSHQQRYLVCERVPTLQAAQSIMERLQQLQSHADPDAIEVEVTNQDERIPMRPLQKAVAIVLPDWIPLFNQSSYRELLQRQLMQWAPASAICQLMFLSRDAFTALLTHHRAWMSGLYDLYEGKSPNPDSRAATWEIMKMMSFELNTTRV